MNITLLDLRDNYDSYDRVFVFGNIDGQYDQLTDILYHQNFNYNDLLIVSGDFLHLDNNNSLSMVEFIIEHENCLAVLGKNEVDIVNYIDYDKDLPAWLRIGDRDYLYRVKSFIENLPLIIRLTDYNFVVNAGIEPGKSVPEQDPEVFYNIGIYDTDSRFYGFPNPDQKSWYNFLFYEQDNKIRFCFNNKDTKEIELPAGYNVGSDYNMNEKIKCLIFQKNLEEPILVQA